MPDKIQYFLDPESIVRSKKSCKLHPSKTKVGTSLGVLWTHVNSGANHEDRRWHDSLVDVKAQTDIIVDPCFVPWIDRTGSIRTIDKIFLDAQTREWKKLLEPQREVHAPWKEQLADDQIAWEPNERDCYSGRDGGPKA